MDEHGVEMLKFQDETVCEVCNHGKGAWDETDWRDDSHMSGESSKDSPVTRSGDGDGQKPVAPFPRLIRRTQESLGSVKRAVNDS